MSLRMRVGALLFTLLLTLSLVACGGSEKLPENSDTSGVSDISGPDTTESSNIADSQTSNNSDAQSTTKNDKGNQTTKATASTTKAVAKGYYDSVKGSTVTVYSSGNPSSLTKKCQAAFENKYSCKVKFDIIPWADWETKFAQQSSAGKTVDVAPLFDGDFANYAATEMFQPVEPYTEITDPLWDRSIMDLFKWKGKYYGLATNQRSYAEGMIYFNKTMFEDEGVDDPYTLYKQGKWDLEQFRKTALAMRKLGKDGKTTVYGFGTWWYDAFILSNGNRQVEPQEDGSVKITINQPSAYVGMQLIQDMQLKDKSFDYNLANSWADYFMGGKMAMVFERPWNVVGVYNMYDKNNFPYELGVAPPPKGMNTGNVYYAPSIIAADGIPTKAGNPKGGAAWIYFNAVYAKETANDSERIKDRRRMLSDEHKKIVDDFLDKATPINSLVNGFGNWYFNRWPLWAAIYRDNIPPATAVEQHISELQYEIDQSLKAAPKLDD